MNSTWTNTQLGNDGHGISGHGISHASVGHTSTGHVLVAGPGVSYAVSGMSSLVAVASGPAVGTRVLAVGRFLRPRLERTGVEPAHAGLLGSELSGSASRGLEGQFLTSGTGLDAESTGTARRTGDTITFLSIQQSRDLVPIG